MNPLNLQNMKTILLFLITCCVISTASAIDVASAVNTLKADDYAARSQARQELLDAFSLATAPDVASDSDLLALEASLVEQLNTAEMPLDARLYLIRMLEFFGSDVGADAAYAMLGSSEGAVRDSARRALAAIPRAKAGAYLLAGLKKGPKTDRAAYVDALVYRGAVDAAPVIAELLQSSDPALVVAAATALGELGNDAVVPALLSARVSVSGEAKARIESALLQLGVDASATYSLAVAGSRGVIRAEAFRQLISLDPIRAKQVLEIAIAEAGFSGRLRFLQVALGSRADALSAVVVAHLPGASVSDQLVIITEIGEQGFVAYEEQLLALLPQSEGIFRASLIHALGNVGGDASFEPLYQAFSANTKDDNAANALARVKAPSADQKALATVESGADLDARIASIKVLELRNTSGATTLLNGIISGTADATLKEAAFKSLESIGDDGSIQSLLKLIIAGDAQSKPAQRSLKRLSLNFGAAEYQWNELYLPALNVAANDSARQALIQILDGVACEPVVIYLREILLDRDSTLRPAAMTVLQRWPLQEGLYAGDLWLAIGSDESATEQEINNSVRALEKMLKHREYAFQFAQIDLLVAIAQSNLPLEYKLELLRLYDDPKVHFNPGLYGHVKRGLNKVKDDPLLSAQVIQMIGKI
jgi:HEAT repeat protein